MAIKVDETKCTGCGICVDACHVGAITVDHVAKIDTETCVGCEACVSECPSGAILVERSKNKSSYRKYPVQSLSVPIEKDVVLPFSQFILRQMPGY